MKRSTKGLWAERAAAALLRLKGHRIRHRNWRGAGGELDIVAQRGGEIVFVEVKMRSSRLLGGAGAAVNSTKQRTLARVSAAYLSRHELWDRPCRFDVVTFEGRPRFPFWSVRHYRNAFSPDQGRQM